MTENRRLYVLTAVAVAGLLLAAGMIFLYAPEDAVDHPYYQYVSAEWAKQWPSEEIWRAKKSRRRPRPAARPRRKRTTQPAQ